MAQKTRPASQRVTHASDIMARLTMRKPDSEGERRGSLWTAGDQGGMQQLVVKVLVVGDSYVGKTQLIRRYTDDHFETKYIPSIGFDFRVKNLRIDDRPVLVQLWDTAGREDKRSKGTTFYKNTHAVVIVFDVTERRTFDAVNSHYERVQRHSGLPDDFPCLLLGNKTDVERPQISDEDVESWINSRRPDQPDTIQYFKTSAREATNVALAFDEAAREGDTVVIRMLDDPAPDIDAQPDPRSRRHTWAQHVPTADLQAHRVSVSDTLNYSDLSAGVQGESRESNAVAMLSPRAIEALGESAADVATLPPGAMSSSNTLSSATGVGADLKRQHDAFLVDSGAHLSKPSGVSFLDSQLLAETSSADATSPSPSGTASIVGREDAPSGQEATSIPQSYQAGELPELEKVYTDSTPRDYDGCCTCCPPFLLKLLGCWNEHPSKSGDYKEF